MESQGNLNNREKLIDMGFPEVIEDDDQENIFNGQEEFLDRENFQTRRMMEITEGNEDLARTIAWVFKYLGFLFGTMIIGLIYFK